jgi:uncharacterized integral membrane protein (TIGR00698 family)
LTVAIAATFLSEHYHGPVMLFALLLGMAFHFLSQEGRTVAGIELASKGVLRIAVGLLGAQITIAQITNLGLTPVLTMVAAVGSTILFGMLASRVLGLGKTFGVLTGGAVAICGASAALAISSVLPKGGNHERDTVFTVIAVTTLSTIAMVLYPIVVTRFNLDHEAAGIFLGGTIHDVAQVVGAGYSVSEETGNVATFIKLLRVAMLLPVVVGLSFIMHARNGGSGGRRQLLPGFLLLFAALVVLNSAHLIPQDVLPCHRHRRAGYENLAEGHGGGGRAPDCAHGGGDAVPGGAGADGRDFGKKLRNSAQAAAGIGSPQWNYPAARETGLNEGHTL